VSAGTDGGLAAYEARLAAYDARQAEVRAANKAALFDALAAAGIAVVVVTFDGSGDSGQIENVTAFSADNDPVELPGGTVDATQVAFDTQTVTTAQETPRAVIEDLAYGVLEHKHRGWEDGDGAFGEFTFTVADRTVVLSFNGRYMTSEFEEHSF